MAVASPQASSSALLQGPPSIIRALGLTLCGWGGHAGEYVYQSLVSPGHSVSDWRDKRRHCVLVKIRILAPRMRDFCYCVTHTPTTHTHTHTHTPFFLRFFFSFAEGRGGRGGVMRMPCAPGMNNPPVGHTHTLKDTNRHTYRDTHSGISPILSKGLC